MNRHLNNTLHLKLRNVGRHTALKLSPHIVFVFLSDPSALLDRTILFCHTLGGDWGTVSQRGTEVRLWPDTLHRWKDIPLKAFLREAGLFTFPPVTVCLMKKKKKRLPPGLLSLGNNAQKKAFLLYFLLYLFPFHVPAPVFRFLRNRTSEAYLESGYLIYQSGSISSVLLKFGSIALSKLIILVIWRERE